MEVETKWAEFRVFKRHIDLKAIVTELKDIYCRACYLIINERIDQLVNIAARQIPLPMQTELAEHVHAYVYEDKMPPEAIAHVVLNVADDFVRGEPVRLRSGDYIAIYKYMKGKR